MSLTCKYKNSNKKQQMYYQCLKCCDESKLLLLCVANEFCMLMSGI